MTSLTINLKPLDQSQKNSMDHLKGDHFEEATENIFCFSLLRKVRPSRERPICPQQEIWGEPGLLALQAKGYHRFNWEEVTIDVPWLMAWPWYTITSIESHKTWGGAWTRIPYIVRACVDGVAWWSPISMWTGQKRKWCDSKPACIKMSWGLCALGPPNQGGLPSPHKEV